MHITQSGDRISKILAPSSPSSPRRQDAKSKTKLFAFLGVLGALAILAQTQSPLSAAIAPILIRL
jgi:hypothetical protein